MSISAYIPSSRFFRLETVSWGGVKNLPFINVPDKPIRPLVLAHHIKAAAERPAGSQNPENLPIGGFLVRKSMKAVRRQKTMSKVSSA